VAVGTTTGDAAAVSGAVVTVMGPAVPSSAWMAAWISCWYWAYGSQSSSRAPDRRPASAWVRISAVPGRSAGFFARQRAVRAVISGGRPSRSGSLWTTWYSREAAEPEPNGPSALPANTSTAPRLKTSVAKPTLRPSACSGDMNPGEPTTSPVWVSELDSAARAIPKSITAGPSPARSTFIGLRSR
jgi:hypothetical protein